MKTQFNVIRYNINTQKFEPYDVIPYFIRRYKNTKPKDRPKTFEDVKQFIISNSQYMYRARCQYEVILTDWPCQKVKEKIDIHWQIMMNIDTITDIFLRRVL